MTDVTAPPLVAQHEEMQRLKAELVKVHELAAVWLGQTKPRLERYIAWLEEHVDELEEERDLLLQVMAEAS